MKSSEIDLLVQGHSTIDICQSGSFYIVPLNLVHDKVNGSQKVGPTSGVQSLRE
jgi:hypothetical protein